MKHQLLHRPSVMLPAEQSSCADRSTRSFAPSRTTRNAWPWIRSAVFPIVFACLASGPVWSQGEVEPAASDRTVTADHQDALWIAAQRICPVSGLELGKHGPPVKVAVGEQRQELFLCCEPCASQPIQAKHWKTIHQNLATAQGDCPVMQLPLRDGAPWAICRGRVVFVCCPPCVETLAQEPEVTLARIRESYRLRLRDAADRSLPRTEPAIGTTR